MNSFRDIQVFLMPDPKLKTLDQKPQFEVSFAQAIEQKPRQVSTSEMEEKIVHMPSIGFHQNVNRQELHLMKLAGIKLPNGSESLTVTKDKLRRLFEERTQEWSRQKLNYADLEKYVSDFQESQSQLYSNKVKLDEQKDK